MDQITQDYNQTSQKIIQHIEAVSKAFRDQCEKLKITAEKTIAALSPSAPNRQDQENQIKLKLKRDLQQVLTEYEKELKRSFGLSLTELETIYHRKEIERLADIERAILAM